MLEARSAQFRTTQSRRKVDRAFRIAFSPRLESHRWLTIFCDQSGGMQPAVFFQHCVVDVPAIDAAPAFQPPLTAAFLKVEEVISRHASLTSSTSHGDLLWFCGTHQD